MFDPPIFKAKSPKVHQKLLTSYAWKYCLEISISRFADVPVCANSQPVIYGVSKNELVDIVCSVEANPAEVHFKWTFNNSAELIRKVNLSVVTAKWNPIQYQPSYTSCLSESTHSLFLPLSLSERFKITRFGFKNATIRRQ